MRILYYSGHPGLGLHDPAGYGTHMREMIGAFRALGHVVDPVVLGEVAPGPATSSRIRDRVRSLLPPTARETLKDLALLLHEERAARRLDEAVRRFRPELLYERSTYLHGAGVRVARRRGIRHVLEVNAPYLQEKAQLAASGSALAGCARHVEGRQLRGTDRIVVVSTALRDYLAREHAVARARFVVEPNAVHPAEAAAGAVEAPRLRVRHRLEGRRVVGFAGSIFHWHRVELLVEAFASIAERDPRLTLLLVGDGEALPKLRELAGRSGVAGRVTFTGSVPHRDVFGLIAAMEVAVMAGSNWYGSPVKLFEYGALGRPVVAPDTGPVRDVMVDGEDGLLVQPTSAGLAVAIWKLLADPALAARLASSFQRKVLESHTWAQTASRVLA